KGTKQRAPDIQEENYSFDLASPIRATLHQVPKPTQKPYQRKNLFCLANLGSHLLVSLLPYHPNSTTLLRHYAPLLGSFLKWKNHKSHKSYHEDKLVAGDWVAEYQDLGQSDKCCHCFAHSALFFQSL
ncbi:39972_t:CDS:2, partial [Gigaspora margarita]